MAYIDMVTELRGSVPKMPFDLARTLINRAWRSIQRQNLWSFQLYEGKQWIAPPQVTGGTANVTQGSTTVVVDATAAAAINASIAAASYSPITKRQFRVAAYTIYNITGWDNVNTLTLDNMYAEASSTSTPYAIFQCYYPAPYEHHRTWISVRDMKNFIDLFTWRTREQINYADPQRSWYTFPTDVIYYQQDQNPASDTYRFPMYELWGTPTYNLNWQLYGVRRLPEFVNDSDTPPPAIGESPLIELGKVYAYQWAEANKGAIPRNAGPDFKFLIGEAKGNYERLMKDYRRSDRETVNNFFSVRRVGLYSKFYSYYSTLSGTAFPGHSW